MSKAVTRPYRSPLREQQANATRRSIAAAAERLLIANGYAGMTIDAIAREARVAPQTVYAVFGSKRGILAALLDRAIYEDDFVDLVERAHDRGSAYEALRFSVSLVRRFYESEGEVYSLLRGAGVLDPELARLETNREAKRREATEQHVRHILEDRLRPGMELRVAQDLFWALTSRDIYRMLVQERHWSGENYERWLLHVLAGSLLVPEELPEGTCQI